MTTPAATVATAAARPARLWLGLEPPEAAALAAASVLVPAASHLSLWPVPVTEAWGFATGLVCVWLAVRERPSSWPVGLANNVFFFVLFLRGRLFADTALQAVYFGLGVFGWAHWLRGGERGSRLRVTRTTAGEWIALALAVPAATLVLRELLVAASGAAPFADAFTTVLSLAAQYLLTRKRVESWLVWIAADALYVPLYLSRGLPLTALLYLVFLTVCTFGLRSWTRTAARERRAA